MRGAARSRGGKPIIALASTARGESVSTIVPQLSQGAGVVTTRGTVRYVVTEWGYVNLHGKSIRERAMALIGIAHPKFRNELLQAAKRLHYVYQDQILLPSGGLYPEQYERREVLSGREIAFRPVRPTDEHLLKEFFYSLSDEAVYRRYFNQIRFMPHERLQVEANVDYEARMAVIGLVETEGVEEAVALAQYVLDESTNFAEVGFVVRDDLQGTGIGDFLLRHLVRIAQEKGVRGVNAVVMPENRRMLHLFYKLGFTVENRLEDGAYHLSFEI